MVKQLTLPIGPQVALAGFVPSFKACMNRVASEHPQYSRAEILDLMNEEAKLQGVAISGGGSKTVGMATFEKWLNPRDLEHVPGLLAVSVFCIVTGDIRPLELILGLHGLGVMTERKRLLAEWAEANLAAKKARKDQKALEAKL